MLEFPRLADVGQALAVQKNWHCWQVSPDWLQPFRERFEVTQLPTILYLDKFGNVLFRDTNTRCRKRVLSSIREFQKHRRAVLERIEKQWQESRFARDRNRRVAEVEKLNAILDRGLKGYPRALEAQQRRSEIEAEASLELIKVLAQEGLIPNSRLRRQLESLRAGFAGLSLAKVLKAELARFPDLEVSQP